MFFFVPLALVILALVALKVIMDGVKQGKEEMKMEEQGRKKKSPDTLTEAEKKNKFCSQCGAALSENAKFCTECGAKVDV